MHEDILTDENFIILSAQFYDNPSCFENKEFFDDLRRLKYIKKLFSRYKTTGDLKERLILNHLIILYNVFDNHATKLLFLKLDKYSNMLVPFLQLIGRLPEKIEGVGRPEWVIDCTKIIPDPQIQEILKRI